MIENKKQVHNCVETEFSNTTYIRAQKKRKKEGVTRKKKPIELNTQQFLIARVFLVV